MRRAAAVSLLLLVSQVGTARAQHSGDLLARLRNKLPDALSRAWSGHPFRAAGQSARFAGLEVRLHRLRLTGPGEAKVSVRFEGKDGYFVPVDVTVRFFDGRWTSVPQPANPVEEYDLVQRWLAQVIDDATEE